MCVIHELKYKLILFKICNNFTNLIIILSCNNFNCSSASDWVWSNDRLMQCHSQLVVVWTSGSQVSQNALWSKLQAPVTEESAPNCKWSFKVLLFLSPNIRPIDPIPWPPTTQSADSCWGSKTSNLRKHQSTFASRLRLSKWTRYLKIMPLHSHLAILGVFDYTERIVCLQYFQVHTTTKWLGHCINHYLGSVCLDLTVFFIIIIISWCTAAQGSQNN